MPNCSPRISTMVNYGEIWDMGRAGSPKTFGRDEMTHSLDRLVKKGKKGIWRNGLTTSRHLLSGDKLDKNTCVCASRESGWIPACHYLKLCYNPTDNAMVLCLVHGVYCCCPQNRAANGLSMSDTCHSKQTHLRLPINYNTTISISPCMNLAALSQMYKEIVFRKLKMPLDDCVIPVYGLWT